ncbi:MAG: exodeoxyribonuclease VII small subunit [Firmicutes bacterium]|nr:exodeoxyribonuclease VII small subunit [Bacillota bacterium]MBR6015449.1 exodeoxyribonuclease VII small subunit [Bacillota bacterium]
MTDKKKDDLTALSFEESMGKLEETAETIKKDNISLEQAITAYEDGVKYYERCVEILNSAKQRIEVYEK